MNRVADVVHPPTVAVVPSIGDFHRPAVVAEKRTTQLTTRLPLEGDPSRVFDEQQSKGVGNRALEGGRRRRQFAWIPIDLGNVGYWARLRIGGVCSEREHEDERSCSSSPA